MERDDGQLDREGEQDEGEDDLERDHRVGEVRIANVAEVEGVGGDAEDQEADQHEGGAEDRVEHELEGRVVPSLTAAPDADEQEHGEQFQLEEEEEEQQVERHEDAEDGGLEDEEEGEVLLGAQVDAPGDHDRDDGEKRVEEDEGQGEAIDAEGVVDVEADVFRADPVERVGELEAGIVAVEDDEEDDRDDQCREGDGEGDPLGLVLLRAREPAEKVLRADALTRQQRDQECAAEGQEEQEREDGESVAHWSPRSLIVRIRRSPRCRR